MARKQKQKRSPWTTAELTLLENHANEGIDALSKLLPKHSMHSIRSTASRNGISIARRWYCPMCNREVYVPLKPSTGWCRECSKKRTLDENQRVNRELRLRNLGIETEEQRIADLDKQINTLYQDNSRLRSVLSHPYRRTVRTMEGGRTCQKRE